MEKARSKAKCVKVSVGDAVEGCRAIKAFVIRAQEIGVKVERDGSLGDYGVGFWLERDTKSVGDQGQKRGGWSLETVAFYLDSQLFKENGWEYKSEVEKYSRDTRSDVKKVILLQEIEQTVEAEESKKNLKIASLESSLVTGRRRSIRDLPFSKPSELNNWLVELAVKHSFDSESAEDWQEATDILLDILLAHLKYRNTKVFIEVRDQAINSGNRAANLEAATLLNRTESEVNWLMMLCSIPGMNEERASAVFTKYNTLHSLMNAYKTSKTDLEAQNLLSEILVYSRSKDNMYSLGKQQSQKLYKAFWCEEPSLTL